MDWLQPYDLTPAEWLEQGLRSIKEEKRTREKWRTDLSGKVKEYEDAIEALRKKEQAPSTVYAREECVFQYCPYPDRCREADKCTLKKK
jgi:hypothetical protein